MISKDLIAASAKPLILSILLEGENYGYDIIQRIRKLSDGEVQWKDGMLYPVLHRMEAQGLILSSWRTAESGRKRNYYSITPAGRKQLSAEKEQWTRVHSTLTKAWEAKPCLT
jgi:PadR family transcriptional regulator, regulatory protein PadR